MKEQWTHKTDESDDLALRKLDRGSQCAFYDLSIFFEQTLGPL